VSDAYALVVVVCLSSPIFGLAPQTHKHGISNAQITSINTRRDLLSLVPVALVLGSADAVAADTGADVRGTPVTPFNSLMFQYRGSDFSGLSAQDLGEPSISYKDFIDRMKAGEVSFVEFRAPDGDVAYATVNGSEKPIRIGEGYPIEQHDGYSSPAFAIRAVRNAGVPYKFIVPGLQKFASS